VVESPDNAELHKKRSEGGVLFTDDLANVVEDVTPYAGRSALVQRTEEIQYFAKLFYVHTRILVLSGCGEHDPMERGED
jgi:hypothetical protein